MGLFSNFICTLRHKRFWHDRADGDWLIRNCSKCNTTWPEPRLGQKIYTRTESSQ